jgi:hypothetical protein
MKVSFRAIILVKEKTFAEIACSQGPYLAKG